MTNTPKTTPITTTPMTTTPMTDAHIAAVERIVADLTLDEKAALCAGADVWRTLSIERAGIPSIKMTDGPTGARGAAFTSNTSACFPCGAALGATWDPVLINRLGAALAGEARLKGASVLLGPTINLQRTPRAGRNFECYSEDPVVTSIAAVAFVRGVQANGVAACLKHFAGNEAEFERRSMSSDIDERTLREVYLRPFHAATTEAGAWAVMTGYNQVNGTHCDAHAELVGGILKDEWGFDGLVMSDWWGTTSTVESARAGLDLEMPGPSEFFGAELAAAVRAGDVDATVVDDKVRRLLRLIERTGGLDRRPESLERNDDEPATRALAREAAAASMVLLRNEPVGGSPVLPLDRSAVGSIAVVGPNAEIAVLQGGGSSRVKPHSTVSPLDAIMAAAGPDCTVKYERGASNDAAAPALDDRLLEGSLTTTYHPIGEPDAPSWTTETHPNLALTWYGDPPPGVPTNEFTVVVRGTVRAPDAGRYSFGLTAVGRCRLSFAGTELVDNWTDPRPGLSFYGMGTEIIEAAVDLEAGTDYEFVVEYERHRDARLGGLTLSCRRPHDSDAARRRAVELATGSDVVIVVAGTNQQWETEGYDRAGIGLPGDQDELIREVAAANPRTVVVLNTGAPVLTPWADGVAALLQMWFPGYEGSAALGDVLFGDAEPRGRLPFTIPQRIEDTPGYLTDFGEAGRHRYAEGVFVGHRWYQARSIRPAWWFGHGLGYTTSEFGDATIDDDGRQLTVAVSVTNTGDRDGSEVVQVYATRPATGSVPPECVLVGYERIDVEAGATATATIVIAHERLQTWIPDSGWTLPSGIYTIRVGTSLGGHGREYEVDVAGPL